jgi:hypothetical protein
MSARFQQNAVVEAAPLEDEIILLEPESSQFCTLNRTAAAIWTLVAEPATVEEIAAGVCNQFEGATEADVRRDVEEALQQMVAQQFVTRLDNGSA